GGRPDDGARVDTTAAQQLLDEADDTIRRTRERSLDWWEDRRVLVERIPGFVADAVVSARGPAGGGDFAGVSEAVLVRRGRAAHELIAGLQDALARTLERLSRAAPLAHADPSSIRAFHAGGLPAVPLEGVRGEKSRLRPWWAGIAPPLAVRATERV